MLYIVGNIVTEELLQSLLSQITILCCIVVREFGIAYTHLSVGCQPMLCVRQHSGYLNEEPVSGYIVAVKVIYSQTNWDVESLPKTYSNYIWLKFVYIVASFF